MSNPFVRVRPVVLVATAYLLGASVWLVAGDPLPGGRWLAVHLFTLGVVTNLIIAFSRHFTVTLMHAPSGGDTRAELAVLNVGIVAVLVGIPAANRWLVAIGSTVAAWVVVYAYVRLRRLRKNAVGPRFTFVVRLYERAHGQFLHGALFGALMGTFVVGGSWYASTRLAHLHANVLGWAGLTVLATVVFFGPTVARTRMEEGADERAARALRHGATGLGIAVLALFATGFDDTAGFVFRLIATAGLAVFAVAVTVTCLPVMRAIRDAPRTSSPGLLMLGACAWFVLVAWADVAVVALDHQRLLAVIGLAMLVGVLAQAIVASLTYVAPLVLPGSDRDRANMTAAGRTRVLNGALLVAVAAATAGTGFEALGAWGLRAGLGVAVASLLLQLALAAPPPKRPGADVART